MTALSQGICSSLRRLLFALLLVPAATTAAVDYLSFATEDEANSTEIFRKASPAVVFVTNKALRRDMFSLNIHEIPRGSGSGFVWDTSGLIVTNYHVIAGAQRLTVTLQDQTEFDAEVIGVAPEKDLAVLRIANPPTSLIRLPVGDSSELSVGRKVLAIGNPFGLDTTLTTGVVSALGREIRAPGNRTIRGVIQTDAAINPGNSGGPLLNSLGQLVGVNTAIYSPSGANAGIGFAIPVNTVKDVVPQLISYGRMLRPIMGLDLASDSWIRRFRIEGLPVVGVFRGLPAEQAGIRGAYRNARGEIKLGDIIVAVNGKPVRTNDDYLSLLETRQPGDVVTVTLRNGNEQRDVKVTLIESQ
ncbi:trypsin-like peptidase domain-containing protein [Haliea sp. E1-2-M8]|uniref:S1C family serine protease n=1 Tax=Haliea sp. E1-2-M8 TaxID=3064706 RepID=UPI0027279070|nr:trypsin-like peptidase domain-containing protein [Haliea sp. E1-2-M8]MDO8862226.1 trypsin-like peptidase domain-containing protein [Haliea sp. E1-2-M8]